MHISRWPSKPSTLSPPLYQYIQIKMFAGPRGIAYLVCPGYEERLCLESNPVGPASIILDRLDKHHTIAVYLHIVLLKYSQQLWLFYQTFNLRLEKNFTLYKIEDSSTWSFELKEWTFIDINTVTAYNRIERCHTSQHAPVSMYVTSAFILTQTFQRDHMLLKQFRAVLLHYDKSVPSSGPFQDLSCSHWWCWHAWITVAGLWLAFRVVWWDRLQSVLNAAARLVCSAQKYTTI